MLEMSINYVCWKRQTITFAENVKWLRNVKKLRLRHKWNLFFRAGPCIRTNYSYDCQFLVSFGRWLLNSGRGKSTATRLCFVLIIRTFSTLSLPGDTSLASPPSSPFPLTSFTRFGARARYVYTIYIVIRFNNNIITDSTVELSE